MSRAFYRNKTHMRDELRARLGFGSQTATTIQNKLLGSWLDSARTLIYQEYVPEELRITNEELTLTNGGWYASWPKYINPQELTGIGVYAKVNSSWRPLRLGITHDMNTALENGLRGAPEAWDYGNVGTLDFWPMADAAYAIRIEGHLPLGEFRSDLSEWTSSTAKAVGDIVIPTSQPSWPDPLRERDKFFYEVFAVSGDATTGATEPAWQAFQPVIESYETILSVQDNNVSYRVVTNDCMVDDSLVLELALAYGKSHYRQADAEVAMNTAMQRLNRLKAKRHGRRRYLRKSAEEVSNLFPSVSDPFVRS